MADDDAAPDGELTKSSSDSSPEADSAQPAAAESESAAAEPTDGSVATPAGGGGADSGAEGHVAAETGAESESEAEAEDYDDAVDDAVDEAVDDAAPARAPMSHVKLALIAGLVAVVALTGLTGWLGFRAYQSNQAEAERDLFLQVGRQGALNLTTIDWQNADGDVQRILDSATGVFYDDFQQRAQPFAEVVKQAQSTSVGTIVEAGMVQPPGDNDNQAQVLVAVNVDTTTAGAPEQEPRAWRMRITVEKMGDQAKVSKVEFVP
ncbi:MAG: Mce protein [Actinomycetia bacterium]|nr:Mce protein [Actinomycetes bacterium]MCH9710356.1 Mce protein [Actinomycetes bacterium]MCH9769047.1 Mce protein [Actinomycetes bacterium]